VFLSSCPPTVSARSTFSRPTYDSCQYASHRGENTPSILLVKQQRVEIVSESDGRERPRSIEAGTISVASAESVCADQSDNLLVVEAGES
jgi:hypothetical protein